MRAEEGNLAYIREFVDRLDGKAVQVVDRRDVPIEELSDAELYRIAAGGGLNPDMMLLPPPNTWPSAMLNVRLGNRADGVTGMA